MDSVINNRDQLLSGFMDSPAGDPVSGLRDDTTFQRALEAEWAILVKVAVRYRGADADPNDVLQEGVTRAFAAWRKGKVTTDLGRYLTVTVRNVAIGLHRRQLAEGRAVERLAATVERDTSPTSDEGYGIDADQVRQALLGMSPRCQRLLELRIIQGLPEREVAEQLIMALGTVKSGCHRFLAELARTLGVQR